ACFRNVQVSRTTDSAERPVLCELRYAPLRCRSPHDLKERMARDARAPHKTNRKKKMFLSSAPGMKMKVLFRADADKDHGLGHLHRCLGLACALRVSNVECVFLVYGGEEARSRAEFLGFETHMANSVALGGDGDLDQTLKIAAETHSIAAVIDSYSTGPQYLANLRSAGLFVAAIDDFALHS